MNIFVLDNHPYKAAEYHNNKHVIKMILETGQLLSTAHHVLNKEEMLSPLLFRPSHINHGCAVWARESLMNYVWLWNLGQGLLQEYTKRYGRIHARAETLKYLQSWPLNIPQKCMTPFIQAMPDEYKDEDAVTAYRNYYIGAKRHLAQWKTQVPDWWV